MSSALRWKWTTVLATILISVYAIAGLPKNAAELSANLARNIRLGLDLKGGSHIALQIQVQDAFKADADGAIDRVKAAFARDGITYTSMERNDPNSIETASSIQIDIHGASGDARRVAGDALGDAWVLSSGGKDNIRATMRPEMAIRLSSDTVTQSVSTIEKKINGLGVAESSVQQRGGAAGNAEILVQLPGVDDPARVKSVLKTAAVLALREVKDGPFSSQDEARTKHGGILPLQTDLVRGRPQQGGETWWLLSRSAVITGRDLRDARPQSGESPGSWETSFVLTQEAAKRFGQFTGANIGNRLAIVLDNVVLSAPRIDARIDDQGRIMGAATMEEASDLALNLRAGALPAGIKILEDLTIGPSLGADSIRKGLTAGLVGLALVIASMLAYYRVAGINAVLALALNTIITVAALSYIDAAWTLPGIAGLVLSIGMAVDSNVLIFERIKEELRAGKQPGPAISAGFDRALVTIIDTHVTTVVASLFLFLFGTGPVRGFAVTLVIGLVANLFTAVFVSRLIFDSQLRRNPRMAVAGLSGAASALMQTTTFNFLSKRSLTLGLSVLAIVISLGSLIVKGGPEYGLDFRGGTLIYVKFNPTPSIDELRQTLSAKLNGEFTVQELRDTNEFIIGTGTTGEQTLEQTTAVVADALREKYGNLQGKLDLNTATRASLATMLPTEELAAAILAYRDKVSGGLLPSVDALRNVPGVDQSVLDGLKAKAGTGSFNIRSSEMVTPRASEQLRSQALLATGCALLGMLAYIAWRFEVVSGVAAVIATMHDVLITLGLFSLTGREINLNIVAALLTLVGYSMNDKIVVFDRVRENEGIKGAPRNFRELVNQSINQTLSRTLLTAGPTLLACLALYFLGGEVLNGIAFALFVGIIVGTYSSIFVASALLVMWRERKKERRVITA